MKLMPEMRAALVATEREYFFADARDLYDAILLAGYRLGVQGAAIAVEQMPMPPGGFNFRALAAGAIRSLIEDANG